MTDYSTQIAALEAGLATGEARIESDGDMVIYRKPAEILGALDYFRRLQAASVAAGGVPRPATTVAYYDPGL